MSFAIEAVSLSWVNHVTATTGPNLLLKQTHLLYPVKIAGAT